MEIDLKHTSKQIVKVSYNPHIGIVRVRALISALRGSITITYGLANLKYYIKQNGPPKIRLSIEDAIAIVAECDKYRLKQLLLQEKN